MRILCATVCSLFMLVAVQATFAELGPEHRPALPEGHPDLTKGEGPDATKQFGYWFLHCGRTKGWTWTPDHPKDPSRGRQILLTLVPGTSPVRNELKVGDVILGVNGEYFTESAVRQFRKHSVPAKSGTGELDIIVWRKGWDKERNVRVSLKFLPLDFTKGDKPGQETDWNLGPTGARGYMQGQQFESRVTRQILITDVHEGSPAVGILQQGDVILGVEQQDFSSDARKAFVAAVNRAEMLKGDGKLSVRRWRDGKIEDVIIPIAVMGSYSDTTPWDCPKNEKLLKQALDYLVENDEINRYGVIDGRMAVTALAFLSTGEQKYIDLAKPRIYELADRIEKSTQKLPKWGYDTWGWAYANILLAEYYQLTGDDKVLPAIRILTDALVAGQSGAGSWGHNSSAKGNRQPPGYGALNQAGNIAWVSLVLAREVGIRDPKLDVAIARGKAFLDGFVDTRTVPYGDGLRLSDSRHDDNGKNSSAAVGYGILGDERGTEYYSRMTCASHEDREFGHTGVWWSFLWGPMGAVRAGQPATTAFLNEMGWLYDLERRWDGGFVYQGKMNIGFGVDENGKQLRGNEHTTPHWDTTAGRVLMFTLPRKNLYITGKGGVTMAVAESEVADVIEAGRSPAEGKKAFGGRFDDRTPAELLDLLHSWSPVVRAQAAGALSKKENAEQVLQQLLAMLLSDNRYGRYGACFALARLKAGSDDVVDALLPLLESDDVVTRRYAMDALGATGNHRVIEHLLHVASTEYPEDENDILNRAAAQALFGRDKVLSKSIEGVDLEMLLPAVANILQSKGGEARRLATQAVLNKLTLEQLATIWPQVTEAMIDYPFTEVSDGSVARIEIAQLMANHKIQEAPPYILAYMENMRGHDARARHEILRQVMTSYGAAAKPLLPELKARLAFLQNNEKWDDPTRPEPASIYHKLHIPILQAMIEAIEAAEDEPELVSIEQDMH